MILSVISDGINRDVRIAAETASAAGLNGIEFQYMWDNEIGDANFPPQKMQEAKQIVDDNGLQVTCLSRHIFARPPLSTTLDSADYHEQMEALRRCIATAKEFGCDTVRIMSFRREMIMFGDGGADHWIVAKGAWDNLCKLLEQPIKLAEQEKIRLVVETGNGTTINSAHTMGRLIDDTGAHGILFALWDPCNALYCGEPPCPDGADALRGGKIGHVHIKDAIVRPAQSRVDFCRLGTGDMAAHLSGIAEFLRTENYGGAISLESTYRPNGGSFSDGFHESMPLFMKTYG